VTNELSLINCPYNPPSPINLRPRDPIPLTSDLDLSLVAFSNTEFYTGNEVYLFAVSGVNVYPWPPYTCVVAQQYACQKKTIYFVLSTIEFYVNGTPPNGYTCAQDLIPDESNLNVSFFSAYVNSISINFLNTYGSSSQGICSHLFKNAQIGGLQLFYQTDTFLFVTLFRFQNDSSTLLSINSSIDSLSIDSSYNYKIDKGILHSLVFEKLIELECEGLIKSIQTDVFKNLKFLNYISFSLNSLGNFYHQIGLQWMDFLKIGSLVTLRSLITNYTYPNRDFCIFAQFPLNRGIGLVLDDLRPNITLAYTWLCKQGARNWSYCYDWDVSGHVFDTMLENCEIKGNRTDGSQDSNDYPSYPEYYQAKVIEMFFAELVPFVCIPCASIIGFYLNLKIIQTINKNKKKDLKEDFYKYMNANAKFNCIFCIIFVFYPMTSCDWRPSYHFCSSFFTSQFVQYYKIVMIAYFGEVIKMCANVSYLMMTLNRYLLVGKDHTKWLVTLARLEFKWVIFGSILVSAILNIGHGWEYQAVDDSAKLRSYSNYDKINGLSYSDYPQVNRDLPYFIYSIVYFVINFGAFFALNTGIEVKIVRRMHRELQDKRERIAKMNASNSPSSNDAATGTKNKSQAEEDRKKEEEDAKKERRVIKMVMLNGIFNFVLRAPDLLFWLEYRGILKLLYQTITNNAWLLQKDSWGHYVPGLMSIIVDVGYFTYILTFTTNFVIFYNYNTNFKEAVVLFWTSAKPKV
jgi:hypothetical protein